MEHEAVAQDGQEPLVISSAAGQSDKALAELIADAVANRGVSVVSNYEEEVFDTREARDKRWEELMVIKPYVVRDTTSGNSGKLDASGRPLGCIKWRVRYPRLVQ